MGAHVRRQAEPREGPGLGLSGFDRGWIEAGLRKHQANYSMVVHFSTNDPKRFLQLKSFFAECPEGYENHDLYIYDAWNGLRELDAKTGEYRQLPSEGGRFSGEVGNQIRELPACLNAMDERLKRKPTILMLRDIGTAQDEAKRRLSAAVRAWAASPELIVRRSLVILLGTGVFQALDDETMDLVATVDVAVGSVAEYDGLVSYLGQLFGLSLSSEEQATVRSGIRGLSLYKAEAVLRESYALKGKFDLEQLKVLKGDLVRRSGVLEIEEPGYGFESIGGYREVKQFIQHKIIDVLRMPERAKRFAIPLPRGILFFGPPGTGKTLFAKSLANGIQLPFINMKTENLYSPWLGETGQRMRSAIRAAEQMSPAVVFIDEIDRFGRRTGTRDGAGEETRRVFSQLLEWLGDPKREAIIVGTTNKPEDLDEAFIRTGRFDYKIPILYPDADARLAILRIHMGIPEKPGGTPPRTKPPLAVPDVEFEQFLQKAIVPSTEGLTGAELEELVTRAKRHAFERGAEALDTEDFRTALLSFRVDVESRRHDNEHYAAMACRYTDDATFLGKQPVLGD